MQPIRIFRKYEKFEFRYDPTGYGSADIMFRYGDQKVEFHSTYVGSNPLWCLLNILPELVAKYDDRGYCHWSSEPGEMRLAITMNQGLAKLLIEEFDDVFDYNDGDEAHWIKQLEAELPLKTIVKAVLAEADRNIRLFGIVGLGESWERDGDAIPLNAYLKLKGIKPRAKQDTTYISSLNKEQWILKQL